MKKSHSLWFKLAEIIIGLIVCFIIVAIKPDADHALSWVTGLMVIILIDLITSHYRAEEWFREYAERLRNMSEVLADEESRRRLVLDALTCGATHIPLGDWPTVWNRLSWSVLESYCATNYINPVEIYEPKFAEAVMAIQKAKVTAQDVQISKVFIVDTPLEFRHDAMKRLIAHHREAGVGIYYISFTAIRDNPVLDGRRKNLASIDFAVFDERVVMLWHLDAQRHIVRVEIRLGVEECRKYIDFYNSLKTEALDDFDSLPTKLT